MEFTAGRRVTAGLLNDLAAILGNVQGITVGSVSITPTANVMTGANVTGLTTPGSNFAAFVSPYTASDAVKLVSTSSISGTGFTVNLLRSNTTGTVVFWAHVGYS